MEIKQFLKSRAWENLTDLFRVIDLLHPDNPANIKIDGRSNRIINGLND